MIADTSQSLRKSGQFLFDLSNSTGEKIIIGRNPFVNQVSFFLEQVRQYAGAPVSRNPFVNQVSFFPSSYSKTPREVLVAIPS